MKFTAERTALAAAAKWAGQALASKPSIPALRGVKITAEADDGGRIVISATDFDAFHIVTIPAEVDESGQILAPGAALARFTAAARGDTIEAARDGDQFSLRAGRTVATFATLPVQEYPTTPDPKAFAIAGAIDAEDLRAVVNTVARLPHRGDGSTFEQAVTLQAEPHPETPDRVTLSAISGSTYALGRNQVVLDGWKRLEPSLVPHPAITEALSELRGDVGIGRDSELGLIVFATEDRTAMLRLFDDADRVAGLDSLFSRTAPPAAVELPAGDTLVATGLAASSGAEVVRFDLDDAEVRISSYKSMKGEPESTITDVVQRSDTADAASTPENAAFAINSIYLAPALKSIGDLTDTVRIRFTPGANKTLLLEPVRATQNRDAATGPDDPAEQTSPATVEARYMMAPVRLDLADSGDEKAAA